MIAVKGNKEVKIVDIQKNEYLKLGYTILDEKLKVIAKPFDKSENKAEELEKKIKELAKTNEELAKTNEELAKTNEELKAEIEKQGKQIKELEKKAAK